jgi:hypothetical protein
MFKATGKRVSQLYMNNQATTEQNVAGIRVRDCCCSLNTDSAGVGCSAGSHLQAALMCAACIVHHALWRPVR